MQAAGGMLGAIAGRPNTSAHRPKQSSPAGLVARLDWIIRRSIEIWMSGPGGKRPPDNPGAVTRGILEAVAERRRRRTRCPG